MTQTLELLQKGRDLLAEQETVVTRDLAKYVTTASTCAGQMNTARTILNTLVTSGEARSSMERIDRVKVRVYRSVS